MVCTIPALLPQARRRQQCKALLLTRNSKGSAGKRPTGAFQRSPCYFGGRFTPGRLFLSLCSVPKNHIVSGFVPQQNKKSRTSRFLHFFGSPKRSIRRPYFWAPDAITMEPKVLQGQGSLAPLQESRGQSPLVSIESEGRAFGFVPTVSPIRPLRQIAYVSGFYLTKAGADFIIRPNRGMVPAALRPNKGEKA